MNYVERKGVEEILLPGRFMQKVVGDTGDGYRIPSDIMHVGYCRYCGEAGPMEPHMHAEETVQILRADRAWVRYGSSPDHLDHRLALEKDMTLQFACLRIRRGRLFGDLVHLWQPHQAVSETRGAQEGPSRGSPPPRGRGPRGPFGTPGKDRSSPVFAVF